MKSLLKIASVLGSIIGIVFVIAGIWGLTFTYDMVSREKIVTPADASIPGVAVSGPFTLKAQADIIREHTLNMTKDKVFAEMARDDKTRDIWVTATTLTTALNLGIIAYALSGLVVALGIMFVWVSLLSWKVQKAR